MSECPTQYDIGIRTTGVPICVNSINTTKYEDLLNLTLESFSSLAPALVVIIEDLADNILNKKCAPYYVATTGLGGRCIPSLLSSDNIV